MPAWYTIPFRPGTITAGEGHLRERSVERAIEGHLAALLRTPLGESMGNPAYGCRIWEHLAEPVGGEHWMAQFKQDVLEAVSLGEPRLQDAAVDLVQSRSDQGRSELRLCITGRTLPGDRPFRLDRTILVDPIRLV